MFGKTRPSTVHRNCSGPIKASAVRVSLALVLGVVVMLMRPLLSLCSLVMSQLLLAADVFGRCLPADNRNNRGSRGRHHGGSGSSGAADMGGYSGSYAPFRPVKALAVDLFPHTSHVEAVMLLER